jgi:hypothetical protein
MITCRPFSRSKRLVMLNAVKHTLAWLRGDPSVVAGAFQGDIYPGANDGNAGC